MSSYMEYTEFITESWRIRAILCENVEVVGMPGYQDGPMDIFLWFIGRLDEDQWFAQGISDELDEDHPMDIEGSIEGGEMDVLLAYGGHPWEFIDGDPGSMGQLQRMLVDAIENAKCMPKLLGMTRAEIDELRAIEENEQRNQNYGSMN